jgi:hypothetical protein
MPYDLPIRPLTLVKEYASNSEASCPEDGACGFSNTLRRCRFANSGDQEEISVDSSRQRGMMAKPSFVTSRVTSVTRTIVPQKLNSRKMNQGAQRRGSRSCTNVMRRSRDKFSDGQSQVLFGQGAVIYHAPLGSMRRTRTATPKVPFSPRSTRTTSACSCRFSGSPGRKLRTRWISMPVK